MTAEMLILVAIAGIGIMAALSAFTIAYRRSTSKRSWHASVDRETLSADRRRCVDLPVVPSAKDLATHPAESSVHPDPTPPSDGAESPCSAVAVSVQQRPVEGLTGPTGHHPSPVLQPSPRRHFLYPPRGARTPVLGVLVATPAGRVRCRCRGFQRPGSPRRNSQRRRNDHTRVHPRSAGLHRSRPRPPARHLPWKERNGRRPLCHLATVRPSGLPSPLVPTLPGVRVSLPRLQVQVIGEYFAGPAPRSLDRFVVVETGSGELLVKTGQIVQTPRLSQLNLPYPQGPFCVS